ncbi:MULTISPECIES: hypothetical protein [Chryseobacterium]|uniref:Uncharacterized protein n=1 Tax=Chryseobacterium camelliae TaxID=1265445 RepID=A0ABU0TIK7_9FLAO|nr:MULTISPECIES: hypothetical protein [Chryseobacterium]MDT3409250.1 hypothetical protein [Pseudacidovorax intermedius]MDQ1096887.1 hypothetical protein [Chryseobacterium camelliae]MDQ1100829.1 hypothetical protein [Chryseobacterium sp. SORGH_AS_1048]MDR6084271.1 hypothetical protein [Chryseobacterium sp. SORGH_AS_0909]MDR6132543.1 hypothetical protein [Chryseobacterium sp. SORGH_AS_1175]
MKRKLYQYLCSLLFAALTVLGFYYGQLQQYISADHDDSVFELGPETRMTQDKHSVKSLVLINEHDTDGFVTNEHPLYNKIRANISENDPENDDTVETGASSGLLMLFRDGFWNFISDFVTTFHNHKIAVSLAHSELLKPLCDDLYIQYRVIRL